MCGIAGILSWSNAPDAGVLQAITDEMRLRGPDAGGCWQDGPVGLGHRRLAIIDLTDAGRQPMHSSSGECTIVFNGEIYNFGAIRKELEALGHAFRSTSDTEVILEAYRAWGPACVERMNGMFAFALWDKARQRLFLARDRLGKKPLLYFQLPDGGLVFASELKALLHHPAIRRRLSLSALSDYLSLSYVLTDSCMIEGVKKLAPGHRLIIERDRPAQIESYWDLARSFRTKTQITEHEAVDEVRRLLDDATRLRMISDVPLGGFLSGGVDSSAIVASMCRVEAPSQVQTYSIGFRERSFSELPEAQMVARALAVSHHDQIVDARMAAVLPEIVRAADEPFADSSMIPCYYLAAFAREQVTVALSGDGGDEIFAGYETYCADRYRTYSQKLPRFVLALARLASHALVPVTHDKVSFDFKLRRFLRGESLSAERAHYFWRNIFFDEEKVPLLRSPHREQILARQPFGRFAAFHRDVAECDFIDQAMYVDINTWLVDDILVKADRMSMAHSLELRCPLLDYRLVEFAASLPVELKLKGFQTKHIFKKSQEGILPAEILGRKKRGFNAPVAHWLNEGLIQGLHHALRSSTIFHELFDSKYILNLIEQHQNRRQDNNLQLLNLLNFAEWCTIFQPDLG